MIAVLVSELASWNLKGSRHTFGIVIGCLAFIGSVTMLQPVLCFEVLTICLIWVALMAGKQRWSEVNLWQWIDSANITKSQFIVGKFFAINLIILAHIFVVLPVLIIMVLLWGIPLFTLFNTVLAMLLGVFITISFSLSRFNFILLEDESLGTFLVFCWLLTSFIIPQLRPMNTIYQIWMILSPEKNFQPQLYFLINFGIGALIMFFAQFTMRRKVAPTS
jgi:hypothetical protein